MRRILFRGKCVFCDAWAYGNLVDYGEDEIPEIQGFNPYCECDDDDSEWREVKVERGTIGQYTGLQDATGQQIFEGDILRYIGKMEYFQPNNEVVVLFENGSFIFALSGNMDKKFSPPTLNLFRWKVVGTIHDKKRLPADPAGGMSTANA